MQVSNIVLVSLYSPGDKNVGYRRMLFFANAFAERGYKVFFVTINEPIMIGESVHPSVNFIFTKNREKTNRQAAIKKNNLKLFTKIKHLVSKVLIGQLPDPRLVSLFPIITAAKKSDISVIDRSRTLMIGSHPPWTALLVTKLLSKEFGFNYCLDFRDLFHGSHLFAKSFHGIEKIIQNWLCSNAKLLTTVSEPWSNYFSHPNVKVVPNGYISSLFKAPIFSFDPAIRYFGTITHTDRVNHEIFSLISSNPDAKFEFYGNVSFIGDELNKFPNVKVFDHIEYDKAISLMRKSRANILIGFKANDISRKGMIQTKIYEYMAARRPIYYIGPYDAPSFSCVEPSGLLVDNLSFDEGYVPSCNESYIQSWDRQKSFEVFCNAIENI